MTEESDSDRAFAAHLNRVVEAVVEKYDSDILVYSGSIDHAGDAEVMKCLRRRKPTRRRNLHLFLTTNGGSPDSAYRIARNIKRTYAEGKFTLVVGWHCKSAGTLMAVGADEIVMSDAADLGPLDTQVQKPDELMELTSGLGAFQALKSLRELAFEDFEASFMRLRVGTGLQLSTRTAADVAARLVVGLLSPVYAQMDPMRLGDNARAILIAEEYGTRLGRSNLKDGGLKRLIKHYPSHSFVIDRDEAREIFNMVREPTTEEEALLETIDGWAKVNVERGANVLILNKPKSEESIEAEGTVNDGQERQVELQPTAPPRKGRARPGKPAGGDSGSERVSVGPDSASGGAAQADSELPK